MAYAYYQSSAPGLWGTPQYQFTAPPLPSYRPQPSWSGLEYYRAHAAYDNSDFYQSIIGRLRVAWGANFHEARHWHRQIYGGLVNVAQVLPIDLGSAAAYEAYRYWKYHHPLYEPLGGSPEMEREAMIAMAVAEATHLWQYTGRSFDQIGLREASEVAAATASRIADRVLDIGSYYGEPRSYRPWRSEVSLATPYISGAGTSSPYSGASQLPGSYGAVPGSYYAPGTVYGGYAAYPSAAVYPSAGSYSAFPGAYTATGYPMNGVTPQYYGAGYMQPGGYYGAGYPSTAGSTIIVRQPGHHHHRYYHRPHSTVGF
ncbi:uncharacterized protein LAESUDRAFT_67373 [Laetiporus sulphureus 93-53]|uniref:Uncharacterized protein n=1 Tax=Laetiporus sulphureus 93-53 TaxID=1314785 RepID=A0A165F5T7_9APHY|nr:uncharacterized protein LAESUDRAFT_67373 [Laetiporus sulphureus 93-53]KZT08445.1 hypothetical protein LAESUDRAFT_67373 [Laetiporus sulphureus 93-53]